MSQPTMNEADLESFAHAVEQANAGDKAAARPVIARLRRQYPHDISLLLWFAYTAETLGEASVAIALAARLEPRNPAIPSAQHWLSQQEELEASGQLIEEGVVMDAPPDSVALLEHGGNGVESEPAQVEAVAPEDNANGISRDNLRQTKALVIEAIDYLDAPPTIGQLETDTDEGLAKRPRPAKETARLPEAALPTALDDEAEDDGFQPYAAYELKYNPDDPPPMPFTVEDSLLPASPDEDEPPLWADDAPAAVTTLPEVDLSEYVEENAVAPDTELAPEIGFHHDLTQSPEVDPSDEITFLPEMRRYSVETDLLPSANSAPLPSLFEPEIVSPTDEVAEDAPEFATIAEEDLWIEEDAPALIVNDVPTLVVAMPLPESELVSEPVAEDATESEVSAAELTELELEPEPASVPETLVEPVSLTSELTAVESVEPAAEPDESEEATAPESLSEPLHDESESLLEPPATEPESQPDPLSDVDENAALEVAPDETSLPDEPDESALTAAPDDVYEPALAIEPDEPILTDEPPANSLADEPDEPNTVEAVADEAGLDEVAPLETLEVPTEPEPIASELTADTADVFAEPEPGAAELAAAPEFVAPELTDEPEGVIAELADEPEPDIAATADEVTTAPEESAAATTVDVPVVLEPELEPATEAEETEAVDEVELATQETESATEAGPGVEEVEPAAEEADSVDEAEPVAEETETLAVETDDAASPAPDLPADEPTYASEPEPDAAHEVGPEPPATELTASEPDAVQVAEPEPTESEPDAAQEAAGLPVETDNPDLAPAEPVEPEAVEPAPAEATVAVPMPVAAAVSEPVAVEPMVLAEPIADAPAATLPLRLVPISLPADLEKLVQSHLQPDEVVLWYERPDPLALITQGINLVVAFMLGLGAAVVFLVIMSQLAGIGLLLIPAVFLGIIDIIIAGVVFSQYGRARAVCYVLTDKKALLLNSLLRDGGQIVPVKAYDRLTLPEVELVSEKEGLSSLYFASEDYQDGNGDTHRRKVGFEAIKTVNTVQPLLVHVLKPYAKS